MLNQPPLRYTRQRGVSLVEVLVTLVILAFGLLGVAGLQAKMSLAEMESYQRSQALMALAEMTERMSANPALATSYVVAGTIGTGDTRPSDCTTIAPGPTRDLCEWSNSLKGASETKSGIPVGGTNNAYSAVGCITQKQAINPALGVCTAGIYQVSVAWQGLNPTAAPAQAMACGAGSFGANEANRRVIAATVTVGTTSCF
jgi:type IV pilus assembly protein PilV